MSSNVWKYFKIDVNDKFAKCSLCGSLISRGGSSKTTSNQIKHLKKVHNIDVGAVSKPKKSPVASTSTGKSSAKIATFFQPTATATRGNVDRPSRAELPDYTQVPMECEESLLEPLNIEIDPDEPTEGLPSCSSVSVTSSDCPTPISSPGIVTLASPTSDVSVSSPGEGSQRLYPKNISLKAKKQPTLESLIYRATKFKGTDPRAKRITKLIGQMMCFDLQPLSVVENKGFRKLLNHLEPRYTIPTLKTFSKRVLVEMYEETYKKVKAELTLANHVAITTDMWTSIASEDYMAVTAHFFTDVNNYTKMIHRCLEVTPFTEVSHTADNLRTFLTKVLNDWGIVQKVVAIVRDNGLDITAAINHV